MSKPASPSQNDIAVEATVAEIIDSSRIRLRFTDPNGNQRTPIITRTGHSYVRGDNLVVLLTPSEPYTFVGISSPNEKGPPMLPSIDVDNVAPMLPMADIPNAFERQSKLTFAIAPDIDDGPAMIPGYVKTSCLIDAIHKCGKRDDDNAQSNFNLETFTTMPLPVPMAPRTTFANMFLNNINDPNVNRKTGVDYSVDFEVATTPFVQTKVVAPSDIGSAIPTNPDVEVPKNLVLAASDPILPANTISRADTPIVDMIAKGTSTIGKSLSESTKMFGSWLSNYYKNISNNDAIGNIFKDNSKLISILIAVAVGSFVVNAGFSAIVVGIILLIAMKSATSLF